MSQKITKDEFVARLRDFFAVHAPAGADEPLDMEWVMLERCGALQWEQSWSIDVRLRFDLGTNEVNVAWSTSGYSPAAAVAAASLHMSVAVFATKLECFLNDYDIQWDDKPKAVQS